MKLLLAATLVFASMAAPATAQLTAANEGPVAMGHHHLNVTDTDAHKRFWIDLLGGEIVNFGRTPVAKFPNSLIFLTQRETSGGTIGTSVNHIGFQVKDVKALVSKLKSAGVPIVTQREVAGGRAKSDIFYTDSQDTYLAFVMAPDDVKVELMQNPKLDKPIVNHHIHFATPDVPGMKAWYAKTFDAVPGMRGTFEAADLPGVNLTFSPSETPVAGTKGRSLDHIGFEVKNLERLCKKLEAAGVKFDRPFQRIERANLSIAFFTDPWGTYIELTEGLDKL